MIVHPLIFEPIFKPKLWGGRQLETLLGKPLPPDEKIGESWEIADLEEDQSIVAQGSTKGKTLGDLVGLWGKDLLGGAELFEGRFPLLIKFLDARDALSVQVHPDKPTAARLGGRVRIKNEAWYILDAQPDGYIYRGVREGIDAAALQRAIDEDRVESVLRRIAVRKGQCYYLPSGTIHALGAGVTVAEVQTPSDITYRVYDWNRVDPSTGSARTLHLDEALPCISYDTSPIEAERREHVASLWTAVTRLVRCESFIIERVRMIEGMDQEIPYAEPVIWIVLEGRGTIHYGGSAEAMTFGVGDTVLLPAGLRDGRVQTREDTCWLEVTLPMKSTLSGYDRPPRDAGPQPKHDDGGFVKLRMPSDARDPGPSPLSPDTEAVD